MKLLLKIARILTNILLAGVIALAAFVGISARAANDKFPTVMGHKVLTVLSGSMEPAISTGDVIIVKPLTPEDSIKEGDIITFRTKEKQDMLITHRVMGAVLINGEPRAYVTKGDANKSEDLGTVSREQVMGIYKWRVPYFGYVVDLMHQPKGIIALLVIPGAILIGSEFIKIWKLLGEAETAKKNAAADGGDSSAG